MFIGNNLPGRLVYECYGYEAPQIEEQAETEGEA
jgi:hypothetical protein